jgi:hypothetical protein
VNYRVTWEIDIEAPSPEQAAKEALIIQRDNKSIATCFRVQQQNRDGSEYEYPVHEIDVYDTGNTKTFT